MENWKSVGGVFEAYEVSENGDIRKVMSETRTKPIKIHMRKSLRVKLTNKGKYRTFAVHRLVAIAFIPNPDDLPHVLRIDNDLYNNHFTNLKWGYNRNYKNNLKVFAKTFAEV